MNIDAIPLFEAMKSRLGWLSRREAVVADNIANSDTPGYRARDLTPQTFKALVGKDLVGTATPGVAMRQTSPAHLSGHGQPAPAFGERADRRPMEAAPNGNSVVIEEQMSKLNDTAIAHRLTTQLYRKHLGMLRTVLSAKQ